MVDIQLPAAYPFEPPKMRFVTKVWCAAPPCARCAPRAPAAPRGRAARLRSRAQKQLRADGALVAAPPPRRHPNVSSASGAICLDVLKEAWSPALTLKTALLSVQALLASPEPDDPQDAVRSLRLCL